MTNLKIIFLLDTVLNGNAVIELGVDEQCSTLRALWPILELLGAKFKYF